ncbi:MAG: hypothetical protein AB3X44_07880 [Leptothrix sp. (in: b-proteobacteria)]
MRSSPNSQPPAATAPVSDDLVEAVAKGAHLDAEQARAAVAAMLRHLAARLPSPLFGELQDCLGRSTQKR